MSDDKSLPPLPGSICPVPYDDDCPVKWIVGGGCLLFIVGALALIALAAVGNLCQYGQLRPPGHYAPEVEKPIPAKAENPYPQFPLFSVHWELCPQCHAPLINEKGEESPGFCEMGFKLLQEDVRSSKRQ